MDLIVIIVHYVALYGDQSEGTLLATDLIAFTVMYSNTPTTVTVVYIKWTRNEFLNRSETIYM